MIASSINNYPSIPQVNCVRALHTRHGTGGRRLVCFVLYAFAVIMVGTFPHPDPIPPQTFTESDMQHRKIIQHTESLLRCGWKGPQPFTLKALLQETSEHQAEVLDACAKCTLEWVGSRLRSGTRLEHVLPFANAHELDPAAQEHRDTVKPATTEVCSPRDVYEEAASYTQAKRTTALRDKYQDICALHDEYARLYLGSLYIVVQRALTSLSELRKRARAKKKVAMSHTATATTKGDAKSDAAMEADADEASDLEWLQEQKESVAQLQGVLLQRIVYLSEIHPHERNEECGQLADEFAVRFASHARLFARAREDEVGTGGDAAPRLSGSVMSPTTSDGDGGMTPTASMLRRLLWSKARRTFEHPVLSQRFQSTLQHWIDFAVYIVVEQDVLKDVHTLRCIDHLLTSTPRKPFPSHSEAAPIVRRDTQKETVEEKKWTDVEPVVVVAPAAPLEDAAVGGDSHSTNEELDDNNKPCHTAPSDRDVTPVAGIQDGEETKSQNAECRSDSPDVETSQENVPSDPSVVGGNREDKKGDEDVISRETGQKEAFEDDASADAREREMESFLLKTIHQSMEYAYLNLVVAYPSKTEPSDSEVAGDSSLGLESVLEEQGSSISSTRVRMPQREDAHTDEYSSLRVELFGQNMLRVAALLASDMSDVQHVPREVSSTTTTPPATVASSHSKTHTIETILKQEAEQSAKFKRFIKLTVLIIVVVVLLAVGFCVTLFRVNRYRRDAGGACGSLFARWYLSDTERPSEAGSAQEAWNRTISLNHIPMHRTRAMASTGPGSEVETYMHPTSFRGGSVSRYTPRNPSRGRKGGDRNAVELGTPVSELETPLGRRMMLPRYPTRSAGNKTTTQTFDMERTESLLPSMLPVVRKETPHRTQQVAQH